MLRLEGVGGWANTNRWENTFRSRGRNFPRRPIVQQIPCTQVPGIEMLCKINPLKYGTCFAYRIVSGKTTLRPRILGFFWEGFVLNCEASRVAALWVRAVL